MRSKSSSFIEIISIIGVDGSGKTTLSKNLLLELKKRDLPVFYHHFRQEIPLLSKLIKFRKKVIQGKNITSDYLAVSYLKEKVFKLTVAKAIYVFFLTTIYSLDVLYRYKSILNLLPNRKKVLLIADRYIYDYIVDICTETNLNIRTFILLASLVQKIVPSPETTILLVIDPRLALKRKNDIPCENYVKERQKYYILLYILRRSKMITFNSRKDTREIVGILLKKIIT